MHGDGMVLGAGGVEPLSYTPANRHTSPMIIIDALAALTGVALVWAGATGRLTMIVDVGGVDRTSDVGNALAVCGGICVLVSALF